MRLTEEQVESLIINLAETRGRAGFTEREAEAVLTWALHTRTENGLLNLALEGRITIDSGEEGMIFGLKGGR